MMLALTLLGELVANRGIDIRADLAVYRDKLATDRVSCLSYITPWGAHGGWR